MPDCPQTEFAAGKNYIAEQLKIRRLSLNKSASDVADEANVSVTCYVEWEKGTYTIGPPQLVRVCRALGIEISQLLARCEEVMDHQRQVIENWIAKPKQMNLGTAA